MTPLVVEEVRAAQKVQWRIEAERYGACLTRDEASAIGALVGTLSYSVVCKNVEKVPAVQQLDNLAKGRSFDVGNEVKDDPSAEGIGKYEEAHRYAYYNARNAAFPRDYSWATTDDVLRKRPEVIVYCNTIEDDYGRKGRVWPGMLELPK